ncbi:MAG: ABC transporter ATP-binding protein [Rhodobacterales bacterium]|nr:MAG: ABC transporter ATP-binding protein [Rhodobacterales bacterium]
MGINHLLENFEAVVAGSRDISLSEETLEDQKLEAFERGYRDGWDDALSAQSTENQQISTDFASNLRELSFSYNEAYTHITRALRPLLQTLFETVLPKAAKQGFSQKLAEELSGLLNTAGQKEIEIVVAPANQARVQAMLDQDFGLPIALVTEPTLGEGQAYLRSGTSEIQIDQDEIMTRALEALNGFFHEIETGARKEA